MTDYLLIGLALVLITSGQVLQKSAAGRSLHDPREINFVFKIASYRQTYWAVACLAAGMLTWIVVLYRIEVSKAVPFLSLGFVFVTLVSKFKLKETVSIERWLGVALITFGLWMISST